MSFSFTYMDKPRAASATEKTAANITTSLNFMEGIARIPCLFRNFAVRGIRVFQHVSGAAHRDYQLQGAPGIYLLSEVIYIDVHYVGILVETLVVDVGGEFASGHNLVLISATLLV